MQGMNIKTEAQIIDAIGGAKLARICETSPQAVCQWKTNGIPKARLQYLKLLMPEYFSPEKNQAA